MIGLYVTIAILSLLLFLLLLPLQVNVKYEEKLTVTLSVLFLRFFLYPKKIKEKDYSKKKVEKKKQAQTKKADTQKSKQSKKQSKDVLSAAKLFLDILKECYPRLVRSFRIRICDLQATVATEDAAKTAILYGGVSQVAAMLLELCERFLWCKRNKKRVAVYADFCASTSSLRAHIRFTSCPLRIILLGIKAGIAFLRQRLKNKKIVQTKGDQSNG